MCDKLPISRALKGRAVQTSHALSCTPVMTSGGVPVGTAGPWGAGFILEDIPECPACSQGPEQVQGCCTLAQ